MPTDPKWRTISRVSGRPITSVVCVYVHLITNASNGSERGRTENWKSEDVASALDISTENVDDFVGMARSDQGKCDRIL
jgi:hypothetical protein